jgi:membrane-associated phospholipid phosphatase
MVLLVTLSVTARFARMTEFTWLIVISLLIILPLSLVLPAEGAWAHYGVAHLTSAYYLPDFYALRSGAKRVIDLNENLNGIIQFPSYHAALGLILITSSRGTFLFSVYLPLNILMIVSALTAGGHHLADIIFGLATVPVAALILKRITRADANPVQADRSKV